MLTMKDNLRIKNNLHEVRANYYLNKSDPRYWRKLLMLQPDNKRANYYVAAEKWQNAQEELISYKRTRKQLHLRLFTEYREQAKSLFKKSLSLGYLPARDALINIEQAVPVSSVPIHKKMSKLWIPLLVIILCLLGILFWLYTTDFPTEYRFNTFQNSQTFLVPYQVKQERPGDIPNLKLSSLKKSGRP